MKKYVLYAHDGSGNHGCEALVRTTAELLDYKKNEIVVVSGRPEEDEKYKVNELCTVIKKGSRGNLKRFSLLFMKAFFLLKIFNNYQLMDYLSEASSAEVKRNDIALSIGGDTYCYGDWLIERLAKDHTMWKSAGLKTVFWGCSIEPKLLEKENVKADIKKFDLITARESISYNALKKINPNTILVADTAFLLNKIELPLPDSFNNSELVGINLSPLVENCEKINGITRNNYCRLIEKILDETNMNILLIPHVIWEGNDDRVVLNDLYERYKSTGRVMLVQDCNCEELKGYISRCRFFVGARTHATIAAYSTGVPTLVLGYSVKSLGIAKDLFGEHENYVLPVQELMTDNDLADRFEWLMLNEEKIKKQLNSILPEYKKRVLIGLDAVNSL
ncbi:MAG: polysaccharide pyruvyl transferase family protein [Ruminococcus sp.]|nr:polysaccharide pyruvyl transferase family protein [Ruminococcus sp.]